MDHDEDPIILETIALVAGEPTDVRLYESQTGDCSFEEWSGPARVRLHIDGAPVEIDAESGAGYGWDC